MSRQLLTDLIDKFKLDLSNLEVYTEAASGAYMLTPVLAALAGASTVYAQTRDSRFSSADNVISETSLLADSYGVLEKIKFLKVRDHLALSRSDIITNSGFVRPIDRDLLSVLKPTAVVPLMWETWEFRSSDFDLNFCKGREILVLGTNESKPPCEMAEYIGLCGLKLLFELGYDGGRVLLLGNPPLPAPPMLDYMRKVGVDVKWVSSDSAADISYDGLRDHFNEVGDGYDFLILAEHHLKGDVLGSGSYLDFEILKEVSPGIKIGLVCGGINQEELERSGLHYFPKVIAPVGFMSYQPYMLGPRPVLTLFAAGLSVGQIMSRQRLKGLSVRETVVCALRDSPAMDFEGELSWL